MHSGRVRPCAELLLQQQQWLATLLLDGEAVLKHIMCLVGCVWHLLHKTVFCVQDMERMCGWVQRVFVQAGGVYMCVKACDCR